jgi:F-type H+-transporting ATPase subunit b
MKRAIRMLLVTGVFIVVLLAAGAVRAEEETTNAKTQSTHEIFKWINFAIVAGAAVWLFGKVLPPKFRDNANRINSAIASATEAKAASDRLLRAAEHKLANLEKEVAALQNEAQAQTRKEAERLRAATQADEQKITAAAAVEIAAAERAARLELKALAAKLAMDGAESLLAKQLTPQVQESLVSAFVKTLDARPN